MEIKRIDYLTPHGRYIRSREADLAAMGLANTFEEAPVKRGRGRPRKHPPGQRAPRRSRAKVRLAAQGQPPARASGGRKASRASSRKTSGTVSPVTAAPARVPTPAPKAAPKVAAALLESTLAGGLGQDTIQIEAQETAFEIKPIETRTVEITVVENDPEYEAELAEQAALVKARLDAENEPGEEVPHPSVRRTKFTRRYDFSDAQDASKVDPAVLTLFPHFGFPTIHRGGPMSEDDLKRWLFATLYKEKRNDAIREDRFQDDLRIYRGLEGFYNAVEVIIEGDIQRERDRIAIWHVIDTRVANAEQYSERAAKGEISDDLARMWVAHLDYLALGNLEDSEHLVWRQIVDAMEWPEGFSRIDLARWAGQDPDVVPNVRSWAGQPKHFPEHLRDVPFPP
ncbi:hypothetical protein HPT29_025355 (plasmid) [Microvirga terrae]|uniref:Uncharacterized protein n=1 Tax=Microvirga terrae TaxID=2740529 RepID=A0ABY5S233_9HYPH|nr:hypothetical protein [Microvirga terrae]UVF22482.1 hypothetical protein HPT29_025355 [Microvirga terrae]